MHSRIIPLIIIPTLLLTLLAVPHVSATQQATIFQKIWGGTGSDIGTGLARDAQGNIYESGAYNYSTFFSNHTTSDLLLLKYNSSGNLLWKRSWGGSGEDTGFKDAVDSSGNIYVAGWTASIGPGTDQALLLKFDPTGNLIWQRTWGGGRYAQAFALTLDLSGDPYIAGQYNATDGYHLFILKFDPAGNLLWQDLWNPLGSGAFGLAADSSGNLYASGLYFNSTRTLALLMKLTQSGTLLWAKTWGNDTSEGQTMVIDTAGNVYMTGFYNPGPNLNALLLKFDPTGALLWQRLFPQGEGTGLSIDSAGNIYNTGWRYRTPSESSADVLLLKLNTAGNLLSENLWGGSSTSLSYANIPDTAGHDIITGFINDSAPYAISPLPTPLITPSLQASSISYPMNSTSIPTYTPSLPAATPPGSETYVKGFVTFLLEYGDASLSCGSGCTTSFQSGSPITGASYDGTSNTLHLTFTGSGGSQGYANVTVPKSIVLNQDSSKIKVYLDQSTTPTSTTITQNATDFFVYFTFTFHSDVNANITLGIPLSTSLTPEISLAALLLIIPVLFQIRRHQNKIKSQL